MARTRDRTHNPAMSPEAREAELVSLAYDVAEEQLRAGTVQGQVLTHFLKAGSSRDRLEQERIKQENLLTAQKIENLASQQRVEELMVDALAAMRTYTGNASDEEDEFVGGYHD